MTGLRSGTRRAISKPAKDPVRVHRSHLVACGAVRELIPAGDGDAELVLAGGCR